MDAHYDSQLRSNHNHHHATHQNASFSGPARQMGAGAGGLGAFAMRMGRVAIPVVRRYFLPVAKQLGKNFLEAAIPEIGQVLAAKKWPSGKMLKHVADCYQENCKDLGAEVFGPLGRGERCTAAGGAFRRRTRARRPDGAQAGGRSRPAADRRYKSKATEHFSSIIARINNDTNHFQINSRQKKSVRYSVWNSVCLIVKPQRQQRKRASNLALPTATTTTFSGSAISPVTHSALDFFEKPNVLINYEGSYDQEVFPHVGCRGPQLDFFVTAEAKNLIDLNRILLSVKVGVYTEDGKTRAKVNEHPIVFSNNTLHTLFSHAELYLNGKLISHSNNCYFHAAFIETELTANTDGKQTWTKCQGYDYLAKTSEQNQQFNELYAVFDRQKQCTTELYGALHRLFWLRESFGARRHTPFTTLLFSQ